MSAPFRRLWFVVFAVALLASAHTAEACWFNRHCYCSAYSASYAAAPAAPAAAAAAPAAAAYAPLYYAPVAYAPYVAAAPVLQQAPAQQAPAAQSALAELRGAIEILKMIRELRGEVTRTGGDDGPQTGGSLESLASALRELAEDHEDLKGRLINNAGIGQAIGEVVVNHSAELVTIKDRLGPQGDIMKELVRINTSGGAAPSASPESTDLAKNVATLETEVTELKAKVSKLEKVPGEVSAMHSTLKDLTAALKKKGVID